MGLDYKCVWKGVGVMQTRTIKFRAWSIAAKKFDEEVAITLDGDLFEWNEGSTDEGSIFWKREDYYILSQFTGLKDENGVCIFESDIIKGDLYDSRLPTMGEVVFDDHFSFYANKNEAGNTPLHRINNIEIIGNIYENPELVDM